MLLKGNKIGSGVEHSYVISRERERETGENFRLFYRGGKVEKLSHRSRNSADKVASMGPKDV